MGSLSDSVDDGVGVAKDILSAIRDLDASLEEVNENLAGLATKLESIDEEGGSAAGAAGDGRRGGAGRPAAPSKPREPTSRAHGVAALLQTARRIQAHPAAAAAGTVAGIVGPHIGAGVGSVLKGGEFTAGFESSINRRLGQIPFLGEGLGFAGGARIEDRTTARVAAAVGQIEALGGRVTDEQRRFLLREIAIQERRREDAFEQIREMTKIHFRDNPDARGDRLRANTEQVGIFISPGTWAFRQLWEHYGPGVFK